tara:strand:- start:99 stop:293 length:195 start_codon:yes stop_codon:yes gene_type:complete
MSRDEIKAKIGELNETAQLINSQLVAQSPDIQAILGQIKGLELVLTSLNGEADHATDSAKTTQG